MDTLIELSWRVYPAAAMMALGAVVWFIGSRMAMRGLRRPVGDSTKMQTFVIGFRFAVIGITLAGLGAAWNWHLTWLFVLSLVFGGEELFESTIHLSILRMKPRYRTHQSVTPSSQVGLN